MHRGYLKLWRKSVESGLFQMPETFALFVFLLVKATHKPRKIGTPNGVVILEAGQYISGRLELASALKVSERCVRTSLDRLVKMEIMTIKATNRYSIYTIVKYSEYQDVDQLATSQTPTDDQQTTNRRPTDDQLATTKQTHKHINTETQKFALPDWIDEAQWDLWIKTRKGKKMIPEQMKKQVEKLSAWRDSGQDHCGALANSALNGWSGLFLPDGTKNGTRNISVQEARIDCARQIQGGLKNGNDRQIINITPKRSDQGGGARISETAYGVRQPVVFEVGGD